MVKLTEKGKELITAYKTFSNLDNDERKALILLNMGQQPSGWYYEDSRKSLKKKGLIH